MQLLGWLIAASLRQRALVVCATLLFILVGLRAASDLPMDAVPDVTNVQVQVLTSAPALSPIEMEQYVTIPVERAMSGLPHLRELRSISKYGLSLVTIVFSDQTDIYLARQLVSERMRDVEQAIPRRYGSPQIGPLSTGLGEIFQFVVHAPSMMQAVETLDWYIGPQLRTVPGIVELNSHGGEQKEFQIVLDPGRLQAAGLSVAEVVSALERSNANAGGGYLVHNREQYVIGAVGLIRSLDDLRSVVIAATPQGVPITVAQLGDARIGPALRRGAASMDGQGEVAVGVALMLRGENARTVTQAVKAKLESLSSSLPAGVRVEPFYDRSTLVDRVIRTVATNLVEGALLVILVLLVLLGDLSAGLIVASTIPLAMLFALLCLRLLGGTGNLMSLGAVDFGLIVDGAVIVVENVVRRLAEAQAGRATPLSSDERKNIIAAAATEVRAATVFGEAIIAIVYVPILSLSGVEGKLFQPMATTVLCALLGAMICSLTVVPALCSLLLRPRPQHHDGWVFRTLSRLYDPLLSLTLRRRAVPVSLLVGLLFVGLLVGSRLGAEFVPQLDEGSLLVETRRLPGIALSESIAIDMRIARALRAPIVPEIEHVVGRVGSPALANDVMGIGETDNYLILKPRDAWRPGLTRDALAKEIEARLADAVPDAAISISQPIEMRTNELMAGVKSDVAAALYGPDLDVLRRLGEQVERSLRGLPGISGLRAEATAGLNYLRIYPDRARLARYGLSLDEVSLLTQSLSAGVSVGQVFEGERRFPLVVKVDVPFAGALDPLGNLPLKAATGQIVPLADVANIVAEQGPVQVARENQSRHLRVEFNVVGRDLLSVVTDAQKRAQAAVQLPAGYRLEWGGQFEHYLDARARLQVVVPLAIGMILFLLWLALSRLVPSLVILANVPFAAVGGVLLLWLRGMPFSISAGVGFIALFGVAVLNGLVLVSVAQRLQAAGQPPAAAISHAARDRLRPVLMTALVAGLGFVPMALSQAPGSEVQRPLATVVIGGLLSSTALTLLLLPAIYAWVVRREDTASSPAASPSAESPAAPSPSAASPAVSASER